MDWRKTHTFTVTHEIDGETLTGSFTCKRLTMMDYNRKEVHMAEMLQGMTCAKDDFGEMTGKGVSDMAEVRAKMMAHVLVSLTEKPSWFDPNAMPEDPLWDGSACQKVLNEVLTFQDSFRKGRRDAGAVEGAVGTGASQPAGGTGGASGGVPVRVAPHNAGVASTLVEP